MKTVLLDVEDEHLRDLYYAGVTYAMREVEDKTTYMHRVIMNCPEGMQVDHINGNKKDNRRSNLRICSASQNMANRSKPSNNTSGYKGVGWRKSRCKWIASIRVNSNLYHLGSFDCKHQAALTYDIAAKKYFGEFADLNFNLELT